MARLLWIAIGLKDWWRASWSITLMWCSTWQERHQLTLWSYGALRMEVQPLILDCRNSWKRCQSIKTFAECPVRRILMYMPSFIQQVPVPSLAVHMPMWSSVLLLNVILCKTICEFVQVKFVVFWDKVIYCWDCWAITQQILIRHGEIQQKASDYLDPTARSLG